MWEQAKERRDEIRALELKIKELEHKQWGGTPWKKLNVRAAEHRKSAGRVKFTFASTRFAQRMERG